MRRTPVYIVCSPRPDVGKTILARLLTEFLLLQNGAVTAFDINLREPSLLDYLPELTETALITDTFGQMALMDRIVLNDGVAKVVDLGFHAFDDFFRIVSEIGYMKEAERKGTEPILLFLAGNDRASIRAWSMLHKNFPRVPIVPVENEFVLRGSTLPDAYGDARPLEIAALPAFLKSVIGRTNFSFTDYLRSTQDQSSELHKWIRANYTSFRELELTLILHKM
ncbi:MAG: hypothetical protein J0I29_02190 [Rhizobiales bacterium]|nr:hypothetical protein [Hyphomicrobiales bacterium]